MNDETFMRRAIEVCRQGIKVGQSPFGAVIVREGMIVAATHNTVWRDGDPTAHAEINAIRAAAATLKTIELRDCTLYSTCEPCPMCLAASHWAKLDRVVFGAGISDARGAGFDELPVAAASLVELGQSPLKVEGGLLRSACADLFREWQAAGHSRAY